MSEPSLADAPHHVRITTSGIAATVDIDGKDLTNSLSGYTLEHRAGQAPLLALYARPTNDGVAFEGLAHVAVADEQQVSEQIAAFLDNVNPAALEQAALERDDLSDERHGLAAAMLRQLADWARGKDG